MDLQEFKKKFTIELTEDDFKDKKINVFIFDLVKKEHLDILPHIIYEKNLKKLQDNEKYEDYVSKLFFDSAKRLLKKQFPELLEKISDTEIKDLLS
mgnify:CR=1 FL=1